VKPESELQAHDMTLRAMRWETVGADNPELETVLE